MNPSEETYVSYASAYVAAGGRDGGQVVGRHDDIQRTSNSAEL